MKILILGTSNSLLKAGWVAGVIAALPEASVDRRGVGGAPIHQFICEATEDLACFDAVILDTLANDEDCFTNDDDRDRLGPISLDLCAAIAAQTRLIYFGIPRFDFLTTQSVVRDAWVDTVRRCGGQYIDVKALIAAHGVAYLDPGTELHEHPAHPQSEFAWASAIASGSLLRPRRQRRGPQCRAAPHVSAWSMPQA